MFSKSDILDILQARGDPQKQLFQSARDIRREYFGDKALLRGVVEITSMCKVDCAYCPMASSNRNLARYKMSPDLLLAIAQDMKNEGLDRILIQGGEIRQTTELVASVLPQIKEMGFYVLLNLGNKGRAEYEELKDKGADGYLIKFETTNPELHQQLRKTSFDERKRCIDMLIEMGFDVSTGNIIGLPGQTLCDIAVDLFFIQEYGSLFSMVSTSPFIPAPDTPLEREKHGEMNITLNAIALLRLINRPAMIPSVSALNSLNPPDPKGQVKGFHAGASNITVNFTPDDMRSNYPIYSKNRFTVGLDYARETVREAGLRP